jgi:hypothetical protein
VDEMSEQVAQAGGNAVGRNTRMYQKTEQKCHFGDTDVDGLLIKWILQKWNKNT